MADLQVCYFCGTGPDDSLGEYAVVPPGLEPTGDQQQSVVLCADCREKLTTVMEPVVEAAEAYVGGDATGSARGASGSGRSTARGSRGRETGGADDGPGASADDESDGATAAAGDDSGAADDGSAAGDEAGAAGDDRPADPAAADESATADGSPDAGAEADDPAGGASADEAASAGDTEADDRTASDDGPPSDSQAPRDQPHADDELVGRNNEAYNKTLRLLQNREFPVERHEIEQVAANAYQLDPQEVSDAIDALISKGLLTQEGAQLVRP